MDKDEKIGKQIQNKCTTCSNYDKKTKQCKEESHNCNGFDFSKCTDYLVSEKLTMF